jgi:hypothetical protein
VFRPHETDRTRRTARDEPHETVLVAMFALASRGSGRRLRVGTSIAGGLFLAGEIRGELAGQGTGNVLPTWRGSDHSVLVQDVFRQTVTCRM